MGFLCDWFTLLPTDPRIQALTAEQINDLVLQLKFRHPKEFRGGDVLTDPTYEEAEREAVAEGEGVLWEDVQVVEHGSTVGPGTVEITQAPAALPEEWEDVAF